MNDSGSLKFDRLKQHLEKSVSARREVEFAFSALLAAANPSDRGLRFLFGNGAEWILACAAWSAGILTAPAGHNANGFDLADLLHEARGMWSVKASASATTSQIRLVNFMGDGRNATWTDPTVFIAPYIHGAVFIDPTQDPDVQNAAHKIGDALTLAGGVVKKYAVNHPHHHISFQIQANTGATTHDPYAFIKSILDPGHFPLLSRPFAAAEPATNNTLVDELQQLNDLKNIGALNDKQYKSAVDHVLSM